MPRLMTIAIALSLVVVAGGSEAHAGRRSLQQVLGAGVAIGLGAAIVNDLSRRQHGVPRATAAAATPRGKWAQIGTVNGTGTTVCNTSGDAYACFALRCGKGRGLEFAFLYNRGDYGPNPSGRLSTDRGSAHVLNFTDIEAGREMVAAFDPVAHASLLDALSAGSSMTLDLGFAHHFSLRGSSREIERTVAECQYEGFDSGAPVTVNQGTQGLDGMGGKSPAQPQNLLSWRDDDTEDSYVARVREAAIVHGGACEEEQAAIERLQRDIKVGLSQSEIRAGETLNVEWSGNTLTERLPVYLMVAADGPVRFKGKGYYSLMPGAVAPFGIATFRDQTRAVVPLYGKGALKKGQIAIEGVLAGRIGLRASVVGWQRRCQSETADSRDLGEIRVRPVALPVIDLDDRLASERPEQYLVNADGNRLIDERADGTWRLVDAETLQVMVDAPGTEPRFSRTGRFVAVLNEDAIQIYDSVDGKLIVADGAGDIEWSNHDSFVAFSFHSWGGFSAKATLQTDLDYSGGGGSRAEAGHGIPVMDLENNLAVYADGGGSNAVRIDRPDVGVKGRGVNWDETVIPIPDTALASFLVSDFGGRVWNGQDGWHLTTHGLQQMRDQVKAGHCSDCEAEKARFLKAYVEPGYVKSGEAIVRVAQGETPDSGLTMRSAVPQSGVTGKVGLNRVAEASDLQLLAMTPPDLVADAGANLEGSFNEAGPEQVKFGSLVRKKVLEEIPEAKAYFAESFGDPGFDYATRYVLGGRPVWVLQLVMTGGNAGFFNSHMKIAHKGMDKEYFSTEFANPDSNIGTLCSGSLEYCKVSTMGFGDRYVALWSRDARAVALFDAVQGKLVFKKFELPRGDLLETVAITGDAGHLIQLNSDGTFYVHRVSDGEAVLEGRVVDDEVIAWTRDMHFDSTAEGANFVNLKFPGQPGQYTFQQFDSRLRVEGLFGKVLSGEYTSQGVEIGVPPRLSATLEAVDGRIVGTATPESLGELRSVRVYQDGVLSDEMLAMFSGQQIEINVPRLSGTRWVSLVAVDEEGLVSLPVGRDLGEDGEREQVRLLAVGIDQYDDDRVVDLGLAVSDAKALANSMRKIDGRSVRLAESTVLSDHEASAEAVLEAADNYVSAAARA